MTVHNKVYTSIIFQVWFCVVIVRENKPKFNANKRGKMQILLSRIQVTQRSITM